MIVISIGSERGLFVENHPARLRIAEYGKLFDELHIIVFSLKKLKNHSTKIADNVWVYSTNSFSKFCYIYDAIRIGKKIIQKHSKEIIIATAQDPFEAGAVALALKRKYDIEVQLQIHTDIFSPYFQATFLNKIRMILFRKQIPEADRLRVVSKRIKMSILTKWPRLKERIQVLPIYISEKIKKQRIENTKKSYTILTVGRLQTEKNTLLSIEISKKLLERGLDIRTIIVGSGPLREKLEKKVHEYNLQEKIVFAGWHNDLTQYYRDADIYLGTSRYEGYGLTLLEAALTGCPIVTTDVGIAPELLGSYKTAYICAQDDLDSFVFAVSDILENPEKRRAYQKELQKNAENINPKSQKAYFEALARGITGK